MSGQVDKWSESCAWCVQHEVKEGAPAATMTLRQKWKQKAKFVKKKKTSGSVGRERMNHGGEAARRRRGGGRRRVCEGAFIWISEAVRGHDGYDDVPLIVCPAPCWRPICSLLPSSSTHNTTLHPNSSAGEALIRSHQLRCHLEIHCFLSVCLFVLTNCVSKGRFSQNFRKFYPLHDGPPISNHWR